MTGLNPTNEQRSSGAAASALAIELVGINKHFGPVHANKDIHLAVKRGTVHGIGIQRDPLPTQVLPLSAGRASRLTSV